LPQDHAFHRYVYEGEEETFHLGAALSWGRGGIATQHRYACGMPRQGCPSRGLPDAMPQRQPTA
jgi:hypothetical protein